MLIKAILVGLVLGLCKSEWIYGFPQVGRPIVVSTLTGLFLGDPVQGVIMGSVLELMFIGSFPIGAAVSPDYTSAGAICTAFAILTGGGKAVATAMALPIALLGGFIFIGCKLMNAAFGQIMMKYLEKDDSKGASRIYIMGSVFTCFVVYFAYAFVCIFAGSAAVEAAVKLSTRYINDRNLPDKAIDLIDEACSKVRIKEKPKPKSVTNKELDVAELNLELEMCVRHGDFKGAAVRKKDLDKAQTALDKAIAKWQGTEKEYRPVIDENTIEEIVSMWTGIPVTKMGKNEQQRLLKLESILHKRVVGQTEAVTAVAKAVRRGRVGLKSANRPIGSFLFLGPTGVGKTELSKTLAEAVFGSEDAMIRVDMSEYMEKHSVSKLIGSPPGYVGYEEGGQLSDKVRRNPYSVVLFDEIEKAHPDVFNILLQVLDDGQITDSKGRKVSFKNTIIIMTSNAGANRIIDPKHLGFSRDITEKQDYEKMKASVMEEVKLMFKPEFINRIDEIIVFHALTEKEVKSIVNIMLRNLAKQVKEQMNIELKYTETLKSALAKESYDKKYGARPLRRMIQNKIEDNLAEEILAEKVKQGDKVTVSYKNKSVTFSVAE